MSTVFKISYDSDIRRITVPSTSSFDEFLELVKKLFIESIPENFLIKYTDDENDLVSITCDRELREAFAFASGKPLLRLSVVATKPKAESKPAPATEPKVASEPAPAVPLTDPLVGIVEQALACPELQGLFNALGVNPESVRNAVSNAFGQPDSCEKGKGKEKEKEKEAADTDLPEHEAICDHCNETIRGIRYKCTCCPNYDLCASCEQLLPSAAVHDTQHLFLKVFKPTSLPCRRPLLANFYDQPAGGCPYVRRWGGGCRGGAGPWGRRGHFWRQQQHGQNGEANNEVPAGETNTDNNSNNNATSWDPSPVPETCRRWQRPSHCGGSWLSSRFVADVTVNDGTQMAPRNRFTKVWRMRNTGNTEWPANTTLSFVSGDSLGGQDAVLNDAVQPGQEVDISVEMVAPARAGRYISNFRLATPEGVAFGHRVWADILVMPQQEQIPIVIEKKEEVVAAPAPAVEEKKEEVPVPAPAVEEKAAPAPEEPAYIFADGLQSLLAMGFLDVAANKRALEKRKGDVIRAVHDLLA